MFNWFSSSLYFLIWYCASSYCWARSPSCASPSFDQLELPSVALEPWNRLMKWESSESRFLNWFWILSKMSQWSCKSSLSSSFMAFLQSRILPSTSERALTMESHSSVPFCTLPEPIAEDICSTNCFFSSSRSASCFFDWSICDVKNDSPINCPASFNNAVCFSIRPLPSSWRSNWLVNSSMILLNFSNSNWRIAVLSSASSCLQSATLSAHFS